MSSKVLWGEGLFLRPQHFQQQDQYHEQRLNAGVLAANPYAWGVLKLEVDRDALSSGSLRLLELALRFDDGETVLAPREDALPPPIDLAQLLPNQQSVTFYAALPALKPFGGNYHPPGETGNAAAAMAAVELVEVVPLRLKVGAPDDVDKFVLSAMPGVRLQHAPQVPAAVPVRPDTCYFTIEAKGQMYERMLQAQSISIYAPAGMQ